MILALISILTFMAPFFILLFTLDLSLIIDSIPGIITGLITSFLVSIAIINLVYKKNQQIELEHSLLAIYNEIIFNNGQLTKFEEEAIRIKKYWMVLKNYGLALNQWENFQADFGNMHHSGIESYDFINRSWLSPKGVSSRQTYKDSRYLYQFLSDNAFQAFIARGHHLKIKGCDRAGNHNEWENLSLLYKFFNDFNEVIQKLEDDISIFLGNIQVWINNNNYPFAITQCDLQNILLITHEGYQKIPVKLKQTSYAGFGEIPENDPELTMEGKPITIENKEYFTLIKLQDIVIYTLFLTEEYKILPYYIFPFNIPIPFNEYIEQCNEFFVKLGNSQRREIEKRFLELFQSDDVGQTPSFKKWKEKMLI